MYILPRMEVLTMRITMNPTLITDSPIYLPGEQQGLTESSFNKHIRIEVSLSEAKAAEESGADAEISGNLPHDPVLQLRKKIWYTLREQVNYEYIDGEYKPVIIPDEKYNSSWDQTVEKIMGYIKKECVPDCEKPRIFKAEYNRLVETLKFESPALKYISSKIEAQMKVLYGNNPGVLLNVKA